MGGEIGGSQICWSALEDHADEQHEELQDWVGDDYDPNAFAVDGLDQIAHAYSSSPQEYFTRLGAGPVNKYSDD